MTRAQETGLSLGQLAVQYESQLLQMEPSAVLAEAVRRFAIMEQSAERGLTADFEGTQLLTPTAAAVFAPKSRASSSFAARTPAPQLGPWR